MDGFGLEVGTTTTGNSGTDAAVEIQKNGTKYTANFTIPRGEAGPSGVNENVPLGTASGIVAQASDAYPALPRKVLVHGAASGVDTVKPTKFIEAGQNVFNLSSVPSDYYEIADGTITILKNDNRDWKRVQYGAIIPPGNWIFSKIGNVDMVIGFAPIENPNNIAYFHIVDNYIFKSNGYNKIMLKAFSSDVDNKFRIQINSGESLLPYSNPEYKEIDLPSDISLADGDTLAIDRDGTTRILHAEGEPTVLENVTLPELPAPTFNVYTAGGYIQPTVDVDYERDVNLVLQKLEAKIASLEVVQTIMK